MESITVAPIDDASAGKILSKKPILIGNALTLLPVLFLFGGIGLAMMAGKLGFAEVPKGVQPAFDPRLAAILTGCGIVVAVIGDAWGFFKPSLLGEAYLRGLARSEIGSRPDRIVDPDDPKAALVQIVPRSNWKRLMLETATDMGYLLIDVKRREVLFEGDRERIRMPADAIQSCDVEAVAVAAGTSAQTFPYYIVLICLQGNDLTELSFAHRLGLSKYGANLRNQRATATQEALLGLISIETI